MRAVHTQAGGVRCTAYPFYNHRYDFSNACHPFDKTHIGEIIMKNLLWGVIYPMLKEDNDDDDDDDDDDKRYRYCHTQRARLSFEEASQPYLNALLIPLCEYHPAIHYSR